MDDPAFGRDSSVYLFRVISALEWLVDREIQVNVESASGYPFTRGTDLNPVSGHRS